MQAEPTSTINDKWEQLIKNGFLDNLTCEAERRYKKTLNYVVDLDKSSTVLEVGCGTGAYYTMLGESKFKRVIGMDVTLEHILRAKEKNPEGIFVVASGEAIPFKDDVFDVLVSNAAIEHFPTPEKGIKEFGRITRRGATIVISSDCYVWRWLQILGLYRSAMPIDRAISMRRFLRLFSRNSLEIVDYEAWGVSHYTRGLRKIFFHAMREKSSRQDDHYWANTRSQNRLIRWLKMYVLDENVFCLINRKKK